MPAWASRPSCGSVAVSGVCRGDPTLQARDIVADYLRWEVVVNTGEAILDAIQLEERYQVSFWDARVIHAARECGADVLYSEDLSDGQLYDSVRVVNPFSAATR